MKRIVMVSILVGMLILTACSQNIPLELRENLANCLVEKGVEEYGAFWCPSCAQQEKKFGEAHKILRENGVYKECDPRCVKDQLPAACRGVKGIPEECLEKGIEKYPTWVFPDNGQVVGVLELDELAQKAGCSI